MARKYRRSSFVMKYKLQIQEEPYFRKTIRDEFLLSIGCRRVDDDQSIVLCVMKDINYKYYIIITYRFKRLFIYTDIHRYRTSDEI